MQERRRHPGGGWGQTQALAPRFPPRARRAGAKGRAAGTARSHVMPRGRCFAHRPQAAMMKHQPCLPSQGGLALAAQEAARGP